MTTINPQDQIETVEVSIAHAKEAVAKKDAVLRLMKNRDFKKVFVDGYFEKEPVRLVLLKADCNWQTPEQQAELIKQMDAIGALREHLNSIVNLGNMAKRAIEEDENTLSELRAED